MDCVQSSGVKLRVADGFCRAWMLVFLFLGAAALGGQQPWTVAGPAGGDARAFEAVPGEPNHLYLGSTTSWLYESTDEGASWHRLARLDGTSRLILDNIIVDAADPRTIFVGAWRAEKTDGGLWVSHDGGRTWTENAALRGQSIRSMAQAPSDAKVLFVGSLEGVFRSTDRGETWTLISPKGSREIHEIESLAVDPKNSEIVYAGTWHLPWKTADGGEHWKNIKEGIIDDSDVFSIIIDPERPKTVYLSACSGIYKSETGGERFRKIQGIPTDARRTRVLMQDPSHREVVYAGTTQGLYKSADSGRTFKAMTADDVIVNDVYVDPKDSDRVLLATDRGGVLASTDGGKSFKASNEGISARAVQALLVDRADPRRLYVGVINDKEFGGAFRSVDSGAHWEQIAQGLDGRDVYSLAQDKDGTLVAGTTHGIFVLAEAKDGKGGPVWEPRNTIANTITKIATQTVKGKKVNIEKQTKAPVIELESRVNAIDVSGEGWVAATNYGLVTSRDQGATWQGGPVMGLGDFQSVTVHGATMVAARGDRVVISKDAGLSWWPLGIPNMLTRIHKVLFSQDGTLWLAGREGVYFTRDLGKTWLWLERLPLRDVNDIAYDEARGRIVTTSRMGDGVYALDPKTMKWKFARAGYPIALIRIAGDRLVAASTDDGVLLEPEGSGILTAEK
ncbi:MAG: transcriptional regulator [Terracidiphilus sp.]|nr:transcriptional regulator [Terracidiphilus sp.]